jgi:hypothetical protein
VGCFDKGQQHQLKLQMLVVVVEFHLIFQFVLKDLECLVDMMVFLELDVLNGGQ